jgi:two-component system, OmpR family, sensor histidine kinase BaeS
MKRTSLLWKLILAFLLIAVTTAALMALFIRLTSVDRLTRLILDQQRTNLETSLVNYYTANDSWTGVVDKWQELRWQSIPTPQPPPDNHLNNPNQGGHDRRNLFGLTDAQGVVLVSVDQNYPVGSVLPADQLQLGSALMVGDQQVGTLVTTRFLPNLNPEEAMFLERTNQALAFAVVGAMLIALVVGFILARTLIRPLQALTFAAHNIANGQLEQEVKVSTSDEIGQLSQAFNRMSQEVVRVNQIRKQMTADIAHDLRTPLTVIAGYIEAMRDGVLKPSPERLSLIYTEIERLQNLVGDLKMLSQVDAGELPLQCQLIAPKYLIEHAIAPYEYRASQCGITLETSAPDGLPDIRVDEARMMQVFGNLISNALRYTPDGGKILLSAKLKGEKMDLSVQDNGEGIAAAELPLIFDRFHRVDKSRHTEGSETGLGLAIVKALVEAHGGSVQAESEPGVGTTIRILLPKPV